MRECKVRDLWLQSVKIGVGLLICFNWKGEGDGDCIGDCMTIRHFAGLPQ